MNPDFKKGIGNALVAGCRRRLRGSWLFRAGGVGGDRRGPRCFRGHGLGLCRDGVPESGQRDQESPRSLREIVVFYPKAPKDIGSWELLIRDRSEQLVQRFIGQGTARDASHGSAWGSTGLRRATDSIRPSLTVHSQERRSTSRAADFSFMTLPEFTSLSAAHLTLQEDPLKVIVRSARTALLRRKSRPSRRIPPRALGGRGQACLRLIPTGRCSSWATPTTRAARNETSCFHNKEPRRSTRSFWQEASRHSASTTAAWAKATPWPTTAPPRAGT